METNKPPLAPLVFADERPLGEQANQQINQLVFKPVQESLLEFYEKLQDETADAFTAIHTPLKTVTRLTSLYLDLTGRYIKLDPILVRACFELVEFLETLRSLSTEIEFYQEKAIEAETYLSQNQQLTNEQ